MDFQRTVDNDVDALRANQGGHRSEILQGEALVPINMDSISALPIVMVSSLTSTHIAVIQPGRIQCQRVALISRCLLCHIV